jgi:hypothetical protein
MGWPATPIAFDLRDDEHRRYLDTSLTRNERIWHESDHEIPYWGPEADQEWFSVVYGFAFDFPVRAASLYASLNLADATAAGFLEVSTDPSRGWTEVTRERTLSQAGGLFDISDHVRGGRRILVRARMKGRDDHAGSSMAQFLRTSTAADGHVDLKSSHVFDLRVFNRAVPIVAATLSCGDGGSDRLWVDEHGEFTINCVFKKAGRTTCLITARAGNGDSAARAFDLWVNTRGWQATVEPTDSRIREQETYSAAGQLSGAGPGPWSGVVDYADGSAEQAVAIASNGRFRLEHRYRTAGKHVLRFTVFDDTGGAMTHHATCFVSPTIVTPVH